MIVAQRRMSNVESAEVCQERRREGQADGEEIGDSEDKNEDIMQSPTRAQYFKNDYRDDDVPQDTKHSEEQ